MADIKLFDVVEEIGNLIENNVSDPAGKERWVFPTFSTSKSNLPQVTVKLLAPTYSDDAADSFLQEEVSTGNVKYKEYYYKKAVAPVNIYVQTGKEQRFTIGDGSDQLYLTNQPLNIHLTNQIKAMLWKEQENSGTFQDIFERLEILGIDLSFKDTEYSWSSEIQVQVTYKDIWVREFDENGIVSEYSLTINTY